MWAPFSRILNILNLVTGFFQRFDYPTTTDNNEFDLNSNGLRIRPRSIYKASSNFEQVEPFVSTPLGGYIGYKMKAINGREFFAFEGVQFAEKPLRFAAAEEKRKFYGNFSATKYGANCPQTFSGTVLNPKPKGIVFGDENCLTCNFYTPTVKSGANYPVILNIYGGGFGYGSSNDYGPAYLLEKDVILVSCNYRIGILGFLSTWDDIAPGNWGLKDISLAIDFIHKYIFYFGGDNSKIVLFGQSAGAAAAHIIAISNKGHEGKIAAVIASSGNAFCPWTVEDPLKAKVMTWRMALLNWCPTNKGSRGVVECLRKRDPMRLVLMQNIVYATDSSTLGFRPTIEPNVPGAIFTDTPENLYKTGTVAKIPIVFSLIDNDMDVGHLIFSILQPPLPLTVPPFLALLPKVLEFEGRFAKNSFAKEKEVVDKITKFYGSTEGIIKQPSQLFKIINDRFFYIGVWKSVHYHSLIGAKTYAIKFGYRSNRGFAGRVKMDLKLFGPGHSEDLFHIFNRTDIEPISKHHKDYKITTFFQNLFLNLANNGNVKYLKGENYAELTAIDPNPRMKQFPMLLIEKEMRVVQMMKNSNVTIFWNSLGIIEFPSLE